jgi:hypothetical protein
MKLRLPLFLLVGLAAGSGLTWAQEAPAPNAAPQAAPDAPFFRDVPRDHWAFAAVQKLAAAGILEGFPRSAPVPSAKIPAPVRSGAAPATRFDVLTNVQRLKAALSAAPGLRGAQIDIDGTGDGRLFLRGTVATHAQGQLAAAIPRKSAPGYSLFNQLRVKS